MRRTLAYLTIILAVSFSASHAVAQWVQTKGPYGGDITSLVNVGSTIYAGTSGGGVFRSTDNGTSWTAASTGLGLTNITSLGVEDTNIFAGVEGGYQHYGIFISTDAGVIWAPAGTALPNKNVNCIVAVDSDLFAGATNGLFLSTDGGMNWAEVVANRSISSIAVFGKNILAGAGSSIFRSTDNGLSWAEFGAGISGNIVNTLVSVGNHLFAAVSTIQASPVGGPYPAPEGGVYISADSGASWSAVAGGLPDIPVTCLAVNGGDIFAGTSSGVYLSTDNGSSWVQRDSGLANRLVNTLLVNGTGLFAGTYGGVYMSMNDGASWSRANEGIINTSISALADFGTGLFAGDDGILLSTDRGDRWATVDSAAPYISAFAKSGNDVFAGMRFAPGILRSTDNGQTWTVLDSGKANDLFTCLAAFPDGSGGTDLLAGDAQSGNGMFLSTDNGATWTQENSGLTNTWVFSIAVVPGPNGKTQLFAGTQNGGLFLSTDEGRSWTLQSMDLSKEIVFSMATIGGTLFAGTGSGVYVSTDNGANWSPVGPPDAYITTLAVSGTNLFAGGQYDAYSNGGVFLSTDNGATWTSVDSGMTNTDISALAVGETNLYAGTFGSGSWSRPMSQMITAVETGAGGIPNRFSLSQNYPNPFNPTTNIGYRIADAGLVTLKVYNVLGQRVATLVNKVEQPGSYRVQFNASNLASGVYIYRIEVHSIDRSAVSYEAVKKLMLIK